MSLKLFLKKNKQKRENAKYAATKDLIDEKGNPLEWELRPLTTKENEVIREECTKQIPVNKKRGQYRTQMDTSKYGQKLIVASVVSPDLHNQELQDSYGVTSPEDLVMEMIDNPGEFAAIQTFITEYNGFDNAFDDEVDEAKN